MRIRVGSFLGARREGRAGGYKEFDDEEIKETRKRRKEAEEVRCLCLHFGAHIFFYDTPISSDLVVISL